jgi:hypothetical protein
MVMNQIQGNHVLQGAISSLPHNLPFKLAAAIRESTANWGDSSRIIPIC